MLSRTIFRLVVFLIVFVGTGRAQVNVPDTPAGRTLQAWLDAFNSADRSKIETYIKTIDHKQSVDGMLGFRNGTGGFDLVSIESSESLHIVGETTGGGAHPVAPHIVADYFMVGVPFAKSLDPVTKTNWEGTGVAPDVSVAADDALETAEKLANEKIQAAKKK